MLSPRGKSQMGRSRSVVEIAPRKSDSRWPTSIQNSWVNGKTGPEWQNMEFDRWRANLYSANTTSYSRSGPREDTIYRGSFGIGYVWGWGHSVPMFHHTPRNGILPLAWECSRLDDIYWVVVYPVVCWDLMEQFIWVHPWKNLKALNRMK